MNGFEKFASISQALAILAVPVLVAYFGASIQREISDGVLKKEYVQLAIDVIKQPNNDKDMRMWAQRLLAENSPTPFTSDERLKLVRGDRIVFDVPCPTAEAMKAPDDLMQYLDQIISVEDALPKNEHPQQASSTAKSTGIEVVSPKIIEAYLKLRGGLAEQRITLSYLQRHVGIICKQPGLSVNLSEKKLESVD